jgi:hypothetical protein
MKLTDTQRLAIAWLGAPENHRAQHELLRLSEERPLEAWKTIESIVSRTGDVEMLKRLGAGPIEDVLSENGEAIIGEVERYAIAEPKLLIALAAASQSTTPDKIWARIQKLMRKANHAA